MKNSPKENPIMTTAPSRRTSTLARRTAALAAGGALLTTASCGIGAEAADPTDDAAGQAASDAAEAGVSPLLLLGDSVAAGQAQPLSAALTASGATFVDGTSDGGGNVTGPNAEAQWEDLPDRIDQASDGIVAYQLTTYDWGTPEEQTDAYERLAQEAAAVDAELLLISMPPIEADEFYADHMDELDSAHETAAAVADETDHATFLDASEVWGEEYSREHDGSIDRSDDGLHTCPQGAARFTSWLLDELSDHHQGFSPAPAEDWANEGWSDAEVFTGC